MLSIERVRQLLAYQNMPFMTTEEVAEVTGVPSVTIRSWMKRGHLKLEFTPRPGQGKALMLSFPDVIEIMAMAQLTRLGFYPSHFAASASETVMNMAMFQLQDYAGVWGNQNAWKDDLRRYVILHHDSVYNELSCEVTLNPMQEIRSNDSVRVIIDCRQLAITAVNLMDESKARRAANK